MGDAAFLTAIRAAPDDHLTRLVYADWLEERGDPRAEYLRAQHVALLEGGDAVGQALALRAGLDPAWVRAVAAAPSDLDALWPDIAASSAPPPPPADANAIGRAEQRLGVAFPPSYRAFLGRQDGLVLPCPTGRRRQGQRVFGVAGRGQARRWDFVEVVRQGARERAERTRPPHRYYSFFGAWSADALQQGAEVCDSGGSGDNFFLLCGLTDERGECPVAEVWHEGLTAEVVASSFPAFLWFLLAHHRSWQRYYREGHRDEVLTPWLRHRDGAWRELRDPGITRWRAQSRGADAGPGDVAIGGSS